jgi:hypothetical protein
VTVDEASERSLFYYLALSERDPAADPVVLWLNGGPGCSSFDGFVYENGPFNFEPGSTLLPRLQLNPYSWSKVKLIAADAAPSLRLLEISSSYHYRLTVTARCHYLSLGVGALLS